MDASLPPQLPSLSELESRMQVMRVTVLEENQTNETFSQRCSSLLSLCQDLYDGYATLLNRFNHSNPETDSDTDISSEVESILSFQQTQKHNTETGELQTKLQEASKTVELLKKLVMLIDMEKEVAVEETTNLGYKLTSLLEENRELAIEALFMKKEAVRLARYMLKMRDEHFHKVVLLQNQIYELKSSRESVYEDVSSPSCFGLDSSKKRKMSETRSELGEKKRSKWLKRLNPFTKMQH